MIFKVNQKQPPEITQTVDVAPTPFGGTRPQALQRLQVGLAGLGAIVLMVLLADVVMDRANRTEAASVPAAASTVAVEQKLPPQNDPLVDAGVVPDLPAEPVTEGAQEQPILPEQGVGQPKVVPQ